MACWSCRASRLRSSACCSAVGELVAGGGQRDLRPVLGGDVLVGAADGEQPAVGVETGSATTRMCRSDAVGRAAAGRRSRPGRRWCSSGAQEAADGDGVVGMGVRGAGRSSGTGWSAGGRPYRSKSWLFQVISPVSRFSSNPPMRPRRWACCSRLGQPRRLVLHPPDQQDRVAVPGDADVGDEWSAAPGRPGRSASCRSARNGSPVAWTCSIFSNRPLSPAARGYASSSSAPVTTAARAARRVGEAARWHGGCGSRSAGRRRRAAGAAPGPGRAARRRGRSSSARPCPDAAVPPGRPAPCPACARTARPARPPAAGSAAAAAARRCGQPISSTPRMRPARARRDRHPAAVGRCRLPDGGQAAGRQGREPDGAPLGQGAAGRGGHARRHVTPPPGLLGAEPRVAGEGQRGVGTRGPHGDRRRAERGQRVLQQRLGDRLACRSRPARRSRRRAAVPRPTESACPSWPRPAECQERRAAVVADAVLRRLVDDVGGQLQLRQPGLLGERRQLRAAWVGPQCSRSTRMPLASSISARPSAASWASWISLRSRSTVAASRPTLLDVSAGPMGAFGALGHLHGGCCLRGESGTADERRTGLTGALG